MNVSKEGGVMPEWFMSLMDGLPQGIVASWVKAEKVPTAKLQIGLSVDQPGLLALLRSKQWSIREQKTVPKGSKKNSIVDHYEFLIQYHPSEQVSHLSQGME